MEEVGYLIMWTANFKKSGIYNKLLCYILANAVVPGDGWIILILALHS